MKDRSNSNVDSCHATIIPGSNVSHFRKKGFVRFWMTLVILFLLQSFAYRPVSSQQVCEFKDSPRRTWRTSDGKYAVKARLVRVAAEIVSLKKDDGRDVHVPIRLLCSEDRKNLVNVTLAERLWCDFKNNKCVLGTISKYSSDELTLITPDRLEIIIKLDSLSKDDREYVLQPPEEYWRKRLVAYVNAAAYHYLTDNIRRKDTLNYDDSERMLSNIAYEYAKMGLAKESSKIIGLTRLFPVNPVVQPEMAFDEVRLNASIGFAESGNIEESLSMINGIKSGRHLSMFSFHKAQRELFKAYRRNGERDKAIHVALSYMDKVTPVGTQALEDWDVICQMQFGAAAAMTIACDQKWAFTQISQLKDNLDDDGQREFSRNLLVTLADLDELEVLNDRIGMLERESMMIDGSAFWYVPAIALALVRDGQISRACSFVNKVPEPTFRAAWLCLIAESCFDKDGDASFPKHILTQAYEVCKSTEEKNAEVFCAFARVAKAAAECNQVKIATEAVNIVRKYFEESPSIFIRSLYCEALAELIGCGFRCKDTSLTKSSLQELAQIAEKADITEVERALQMCGQSIGGSNQKSESLVYFNKCDPGKALRVHLGLLMELSNNGVTPR